MSSVGVWCLVSGVSAAKGVHALSFVAHRHHAHHHHRQGSHQRLTGTLDISAHIFSFKPRPLQIVQRLLRISRLCRLSPITRTNDFPPLAADMEPRCITSGVKNRPGCFMTVRIGSWETGRLEMKYNPRRSEYMRSMASSHDGPINTPERIARLPFFS